MKKHTMKSFLKSLLALVLCLCMSGSALADVLTLPKSIKVIEEEAFYGDQSIDEVVLPEGVEEIGPRAFGDSSLTKINLPDSLTSIDESALENLSAPMVQVNPGSYAYQWASSQHFIAPSDPGNGFFGMFGNNIRNNTITDWQVSDGAFKLTVDMFSARILTQAQTNGCTKVHYLAYPLNEEPDFTDPYQIRERVGDFAINEVYDIQTAISLVQRAYSNGGNYLSIPVETLENYPYFKIHYATEYEDHITWNCIGIRVSGIVAVESITLDHDTLDMMIGDTETLTATVLPDNATDPSITWTSGDESIVTVDQNGTVTAIASGRTTIIATAQDGSDLHAECIVIVQPFTPPEEFDYFDNGDGTCSIRRYNGEDTAIVIPSENPDGLPVIGIGEYAFADNENLTSVLMHNGIITIGSHAFFGCDGLTGELMLPDSLTSIGRNAFYECSGLTGELILPESLTVIGNGAFEGCSGFVGEVEIPENLVTIDSYAFSGCTGLTNFSVVSNNPAYKSVEGILFNNAGNVLVRALPGKQYQDYVVPSYVSEIGIGAFSGCKLFSGSLVLSNNVISIGDNAFNGCTGFTGNLTLPDGLISIGNRAFCNNRGFNGTLYIPGSVTSIGEYAFDGCKNFTGDLIIPDGVNTIGKYAFRYCSGFNGKLTVSESVSNVGESAFYGCNNITKIYFLSSTAEIGRYAFSGCNRIAQIYAVPDSTPWNWFVENGFGNKLIDWNGGETPLSYFTYADNGDGTCTITGYTGPKETEENINIPRVSPEGLTVTAIGEKAFYNYQKLKGGLTIPESVTSIGRQAFGECKGLTGSLILPENLAKIDHFAFTNCSGFTGNLVLPANLMTIGDSAFRGCHGFTGDLYIPNSVTDIGNMAFKDCTGFSGTLTLPEGLKRINPYTFSGCTGLSGTLTIPDSVEMINLRAFESCGFTGTLTIPDNVTEISGDGPFSGCFGLTDFEVTSGNTAFKAVNGVLFSLDGTKLRYVLAGKQLDNYHIPTGVTEIGPYAFEQCAGLTGNLVVSDGVTEILWSAFEKCSNLESVLIPESVVEIDNTAFVDCTALTNVTFQGEETTFTDGDPFEGCLSLECIYCLENSNTWNNLVAAGYEELLVPLTASAMEIQLNHDALEMTVGDTETLVATVLPETVESPITWISSDETVVTVDQSGLVTAIAAGEATITVTLDENPEISDSCVITVIPNNNLYVTLSCSNDTATLYDTVIWTAEGVNGTEPYKYRFYLYHDGVRVPDATQAYSTDNSYYYTFNETGDYYVVVTVKDGNNKTAEKQSGVISIVESLRVSEVNCDLDYIETSDPVTWNAVISGGEAPYQVQYVLKQEETILATQEYSSETSFSYTFETGGSYLLEVNAKDKTNAISDIYTLDIYVAVKSLEIVSISSAEEWVSMGDEIVWTVTATGGIAPLEYAFDIFVDGEEWDNYSFSSSNVCRHMTDEAGEYKLHVIVRDAEGNSIENYIDDETNPVVHVYGSLNITAINAETNNGTNSVLSGEPVLWTADVSGGKGILTYNWYIYRDGTLEYTERNTVGTVLWTPLLSGTYSAQVIVTDEDDATSEKTGGTVESEPHPSTPVSEFRFNKLEGQNCEIAGYDGMDTAIILPTEWTDENNIKRYVKGIADGAFANNERLASVIIPDCVRTMGDCVFQDCPNLVYVKGGSSLENVGSNAFNHCENLRKTEFEPATKEIGDYAFTGCSSITHFEGWYGLESIGTGAFNGNNTLRSIDLVNTVITIGSSAFQNCENLSNVNLTASSVTSIGSSAFQDCPALTNVNLNDSLISIDYYAFSSCVNLTNIELPDSIQILQSYVFDNCTSLTTVNFPKRWAECGPYAASPFTNCSVLTTMTIPEGVTDIPGYAFAGAESFTSIHLPTTLNSIGESAFSGCIKLPEINLPEQLTVIQHNAFQDCISITDIAVPGHVSSIEDSTFSGCYLLEHVDLPETLEKIGVNAFATCLSLRNITLPNSIRYLNSYAFDGCANLTTVNYPISWEECGPYASSPFTNCESLIEMTVPEGVTVIPPYAFANATGFAYIHLPTTLNSIGNDAFNGCIGLITISIPQGVTHLETNTFSGCTGLESADLPEGLLSIDEGAFGGCTELPSIHLPDSIQYLRSLAFEGCTGLKTVNYPLNWMECGPFAASPFTNCESLIELTVPEGVTAIPSYAFAYATGFAYIHLPTTLNSIGSDAFNGCTGLITISIPQGVTHLDYNTFNGCAGLISVELPEGLLRIDDGAFDGCTELTSIHLPDSIEYLGNNAFDDCTRLTAVNYPLNWTECGPNVASPFTNCETLTHMTIPEGVRRIPNYAFAYAESFRGINIPSTLQLIGEGAFEGCSTELILYNVPEDSWIVSVAAGYGIQTSPDPMDVVYGSLSGRVVDEAGNPIQNVSVLLYPYGSNIWINIDTTEADGSWSFTDIPMNDQYIIKFYASGYEFGTNAYQFAPGGNGNDVGDITGFSADNLYAYLSGTVTLESSEPASNVYITAINTGNKNDSYTTMSDASGRWTLFVRKGATYQINYWHQTYNFDSAIVTASAGAILTAEAVFNGVIDDTYDFTMQYTDGTDFIYEDSGIPSAVVNKEIEFHINAPSCTYVRLIVDGKCYDQPVKVENGVAIYRRPFNLSKDIPRSIQFQVMKENELDFSIFTPAHSLLITCSEKLLKAVFYPIDTYSLTSSSLLSINWDDIPHAIGYKVYLYYDGIRFFPENDDSDVTYTDISSFSYQSSYPALHKGDKWTAEIVAIGEEDWSSSTSTTDAFEIVEFKGDIKFGPFENENLIYGESFNIPVIIEDDDAFVEVVIIPPDGPVQILSNLESEVFSLTIDHSGEYIFRLFAEGKLLEEKTIIVAPPVPINTAFSDFKIGNGWWSQSYATGDILACAISQYRYDRVEIVDISQEPGVFVSELTEYESYNSQGEFIGYSYEKIIPINGKDRLKRFQVKGIVGNDTVAEKKFGFYCYTPISGIKNVYPIDDLTQIYVDPQLKKIRATLTRADEISIYGTYGNDLYFGRFGSDYANPYNYGFIKRDDVCNISGEDRDAIVIDHAGLPQFDYIDENHNIRIMIEFSNIPSGCTVSTTARMAENGEIIDTEDSTTNNGQQILEKQSQNYSVGECEILTCVKDTDGIIIKELRSSINILESESVYNLYTSPGAQDVAFKKPATGFSNALAYYSSVLAQGAYNASECESLLIEMGFDGNDIRRYNEDSTYYTTAVTIAHKKVLDENGELVPLIALCIRGTNGTVKEWRGNFIIGNGNEHEGFSRAARTVMDHFNEYVNEYLGDEKYDVQRGKAKIWITGHSRGAAVGNYLAGAIMSKIFRDSDIYAYLYAVPNVSKDANGHNNIKNFNIGGDLIPRLPLGDYPNWNYHRYGVTIDLRNGITKFGLQMASVTQMDEAIDVIASILKTPATAEALANAAFEMLDQDSLVDDFALSDKGSATAFLLILAAGLIAGPEEVVNFASSTVGNQLKDKINEIRNEKKNTDESQITAEKKKSWIDEVKNKMWESFLEKIHLSAFAHADVTIYNCHSGHTYVTWMRNEFLPYIWE